MCAALRARGAAAIQGEPTTTDARRGFIGSLSSRSIISGYILTIFSLCLPAYKPPLTITSSATSTPSPEAHGATTSEAAARRCVLSEAAELPRLSDLRLVRSARV